MEAQDGRGGWQGEGNAVGGRKKDSRGWGSTRKEKMKKFHKVVTSQVLEAKYQ